MANQRPIFVVGCPRSGTTMLQLMLHAHPRIAIPPETRFVLEGYWRRKRFGDLRQPERRRELARWILHTKTTRAYDLGLDTAAVEEEIVAGPPTLGSAMGIVFRAYARRFGKPRWGDKRPAYVDNLDLILRMFPDAQIITIIRDGRDCVASLKEMPWHHAGIYESISIWARAVDRAREAGRRLGPDRYHELSYERLVRDPEPDLRALCDFLGEPFDPAMTEPASVADVAVPADKTWHERTRKAVSDDRVGSWRTRLSPDEIALCETILGPRLRSCGYELSGTRPPTTAAAKLRYAAVAGRHTLGRVRRAAVLGLDRVTGAVPLAAQLDQPPAGDATPPPPRTPTDGTPAAGPTPPTGDATSPASGPTSPSSEANGHSQPQGGR